MSAQPDQRPGTCEEFIANLNGGSDEGLRGTAEVAQAQAARGSAAGKTPASKQIETPANSTAEAPPPAAKSGLVGSDWLWFTAAALAAALISGLFLLSRLVAK
jgi:hypothetical protein